VLIRLRSIASVEALIGRFFRFRTKGIIVCPAEHTIQHGACFGSQHRVVLSRLAPFATRRAA
jgi:hypothetical protein